ncbi:MAG: ribosome biogenesis GTPase Der [Kiritimatiellae bacterium]|nr:ribosome biogenesis GTPase Der [Kiritimatiellia bacterium]
MNNKPRVVVIVGRPNVGKSAIFNRLAGGRIAIVHAQSGVTRDRLMREVTWRDERFELIDTGGLCCMDKKTVRDHIEAGIEKQVSVALEDAAVAILVVDIEAGIVPMDNEVAALLRKSGIFTVVAANKADIPEKDHGSDEFTQIGRAVYPVSALHNRGFDSLMKTVVAALPETENTTITNPLRVAIVGHPNVGKSSYINRLLRSDRVIVSNIPGTTRDSIDIPFIVGNGDQARRYVLIDTAGMRKVGKIDSSVERFSHFRSMKSVENADVTVLVLDAISGMTSQDKKIAASILENQKGCVVLINKWDISEITQKKYGPTIFHAMPFMAHCPVVFMSAKTGYNIRKTVEAIDHVAAQIDATIPTGILNKTILDAYERTQPHGVKGRRLKIFYATQVGRCPVRFRLVVNDPRLVYPEYKSYLVRRIREKFGLEGAPIILQFKSRSRKTKC